jgi:hypothetical protein
MEYLTLVPAPWTCGRLHPRIELAGVKQHYINLRKQSPFDNSEKRLSWRVVEDLSRQICQLQCGRHRANLPRIQIEVFKDGVADIKKRASLRVPKYTS